MKVKKKILVVGSSRKTRGGITSVIKLHEKGAQWEKFSCYWVQTHRDGSAFTKLWYAFSGYVIFLSRLPFYDMAHIHLSDPKSAIRKVIFMWTAKLFRKKTIVHFHSSSEKYVYDPRFFKLYTYLFSRADIVLVLSEQWKRWINEGLKLTDDSDVNLKVLFNPCSEVKRVENLREKEILFAGTIMHRKRYADLIEGFALIANKYPDWKVVFAGNGEIENGKALAEKRQITDQIQWLGWINGDAKDLAFNRASIYCLASDGEGFPMAVLDAWSYGIPCTMTPVGGIPDIVEDGKEGLIFPIGDTQKLAQTLEKLILDEALRKSIVSETDKLVYGMLSVDAINKELDTIYMDLLARRETNEVDA